MKVKISLCLKEYHNIKAYRGVEVEFHAFLVLEVDGSEWSASSHGRLIPKRIPVPIELEAGWGPEPARKFCSRDKYLVPAGIRTRYTDYAIWALPGFYNV